MTIQQHKADFPALSGASAREWAAIAPAIVGDCMNRQGVMAGRIAPLRPGMALCGQARTVQAIPGDNSALHAILPMMKPGEILVADAGGFIDRAVWGGIMNRIAIARQLGGLVLDGAVRDLAELRAMDLPVYAAGACPAGPHKGWGGQIDGPISCGGVVVRPGDILLGDDDGIAVVPLERADQLLAAAKARGAMEAEMIRRIEAGEDSRDLLPANPVEFLEKN